MRNYGKYRKKKEEPYIYPHKHCAKCGKMMDETQGKWCKECYEKIKKKEKEEKSFFQKLKFWKK
ncbi:MAG: hypothetical protein R6U96_11930 [Promethearchaeia archaeon]